MSAAKKYVYGFNEGSKEMTDFLGGKGAHLAEMARLGMPVPDGFTITTEACKEYFAQGVFPAGMWEQTVSALKRIEQVTGKKIGDPTNPLLVSCRSGAKVSMPGMMDTILNLGMNDEITQGLGRITNSPEFAHNCRERLAQMFRATVGEDPPEDPIQQLRLAIEAVFKSWNGKRAIDYRNAAGISHNLGTAVTIVAMVFGNMGNDSATGVAMTRNGDTGEPKLEGDFLINAQGEDVVAGTRLTKPIQELEQDMPEIYQELFNIAQKLERHYRDMQDIEFTIEQGKLWILQTRSGKRTARAAVRIAVEMAEEGLILKSEAVQRIEPSMLTHLLHPNFEENAKKIAIGEGRKIGIGLKTSPGSAVGCIALEADIAKLWVTEGREVILVRPETKADDVDGMLAARGILTGKGGTTSHAAVVARHFGKPAVVGCGELEFDFENRLIRFGNEVLREGDILSMDGGTGEIFKGAIKEVVPDSQDPYLIKLLSFADELSKVEVWANADRPGDALLARKFGARGIGLCRTEHMFFNPEQVPIFQAMILAETREEREKELAKLLPLQRSDFEGLFRAMEGLPVVIRLLDPPLHEFLPKYEKLLNEVMELRYGGDEIRIKEKERLLKAVQTRSELNPMLGLRGVRLSIVMPEIAIMQVRAIMEAACNVQKEGKVVRPKIMIPLIAHVNELNHQYEILRTVAEQVLKEQGAILAYQLGTMIELPRASVIAGELGKISDFFSFGTNDLTQMTYGISRDDAEKGFLMHYLEHGILSENPFETIDEEGVGELIAIGVERGRKARPGLEIGICGEHGGDPKSIAFCDRVGMNYVSCAPLRIPIARLAAAHAALKRTRMDT